MTSPRSVCLFLGPYRNLTTLTAAILALHPRCQVLNHGRDEVFRSGEDNFLLNGSEASFERFVRLALAHSEGGHRGDRGGSITLSHAFDHDAVRDAYARRHGDARFKEVVDCLVWKESLRTSNVLRKHDVDVGGLLARHPSLRFLLPVRNPLDTARSNLQTGHYEIFRDLKDDTVEAVVDAVLDEIGWFLDLKAAHPGRFFLYYAHTFDDTLLRALSEFLLLPADETWFRDALQCFSVKPSYDHPEHSVNHYKSSVETLMSRHPRDRRLLLDFCGPSLH